MKSIKQIILDSLKYFRISLLKHSPVSGDTTHALSCDGAYNLIRYKSSSNVYASIAANERKAYTLSVPNIPTENDNNYNWYLVNAVFCNNSGTVVDQCDILRTSDKQIYVYARGTKVDNPRIIGYWLGIRK